VGKGRIVNADQVLIACRILHEGTVQIIKDQ